MSDGHCDRCEQDRETTTLYRHGRPWAQLCEPCHDVLAEMVASPDDEAVGEKPPLERWKEHQEPFKYEPPEKPADAWTSEEREELYDRVIRRAVQWLCGECTGRGPIRSLKKARRHVESNHAADLVETHATPRAEQETATDGGQSRDEAAKRAEENHGLGEFDVSTTETDQDGEGRVETGGSEPG
jgi:hypothetical protein